MDWEAFTPIAAIAATTIVGVVAVVVPALGRRGDRQHERELLIRNRRAEAYAHVLGIMQDVRHLLAGDAVNERMREPAILIWLWGSAEVRELFFAWAKIMPKGYGPSATDADKERVLDAANAVRQRMADELQGRVTLG
jgi:hypothetical protein